MTNAERQRKHREAQRALGRTARTLLLTEDEAFYLNRVLQQMRKNPNEKPAAMRCTATGRFTHLDV